MKRGEMMILLTGANGQLGQDFQKVFTQKGIRYIATDYCAARNCEALDITKPAEVEAFLKGKAVELIINCAAYNDVDQAEAEREKALLLNCRAPKSLAEIAHQRGSVFVTYSSDFVFDGNKGVPYVEEDPTHPLSAYGSSKARGEREVLAAHDQALVIRTSWVFGMGNHNFNRAVIRWSQTNRKLRIVDDQVSAPTYSRDLAEFSWELIRSRRYGLYHISNTGQASKYDQAKYVLERIGWQGRLERAKTAEFNLPASRPRYSKLDGAKAERVIGSTMPEWADGIDRFLEEMKEAGEI
jgi:dTDP-4-dehydrorhamnose reductase